MSEHTYQHQATGWNKKFKAQEIDCEEITAFDMWCIERVLENVSQIPTVAACLEKKLPRKGIDRIILPQTLPEYPEDKILGDPNFLRAAHNVWFQTEAGCFQPAILSVAEKNKKEFAWEALTHLPSHAPVSIVKHVIGIAKKHGNEDKAIRKEVKKKFGFEGEMPPWKEKIISKMAGENLVEKKNFFYSLQIKYTEMQKSLEDHDTDMGIEFAAEVLKSTPKKRSASVMYKEEKLRAAMIAIKGSEDALQDAMHDEEQLGLYQLENDLWLQGKAPLSLQPDYLEGHIEFHKDHKLGFSGSVIDGVMFGDINMKYKDAHLDSKIKAGKVNGRVNLTHKSGHYDGDSENGKRVGEGKFNSGTFSYSGQWQDDTMNGAGEVETSAFKMTGTFYKNLPQSFQNYQTKNQGTSSSFTCINNPENERASFEFEMDRKKAIYTHDKIIDINDELIAVNGEVKIVDEKGTVIYEGEVVEHKFHGKGVLNLESYVYEGEFQNGKRHGRGKLTMLTLKMPETATEYAELRGDLKGSYWMGNWKDDKPHGGGTLFYQVDGEVKCEHSCDCDQGIPPPAPAEEKPKNTFPMCCCAKGAEIPEYPKQVFSVLPATVHIPMTSMGDKQGFKFEMLKGCTPPRFDLAEAAHVPDNLLHEFMHEISGGLVSNQKGNQEVREWPKPRPSEE